MDFSNLPTANVIFERLGLALLLGLLVGLQRERAHSRIAGLRTFPLIAMFGVLCGYLGPGNWVIATGLLAVLGIAFIGNFSTGENVGEGSGITTEAAMLLMYVVGVFLAGGPVVVPIVIGGLVAVMLQFKPEMHRAVARLGDNDVRAIFRLAILAMVILPLIPDKAMGPFDVINPHEIWLLVVFVVGLNLAGYILNKFVGPKVGTFASGLLGGMVSSTATTLTQSRRTRRSPALASLATTVVLLASTVVYPRVALEMGVASPQLLKASALSLSLWFIFSLATSLAFYFGSRKKQERLSEEPVPHAVKEALFFGATYAVVVLAIAAVKHKLGTGALFGVAAISGLTDVDALTLSTARLVEHGQLPASDGRKMVVIAIMSNLLFKFGMVALVGRRELIWRLGIGFGALFVFGGGLFLFS